MSKFDQIKVDQLGLEFLDLDSVFTAFDSKKNAKDDEPKNVALTFGPSEVQQKSYKHWPNSNGQLFFPYNKQAKIGKISDFINEESKKQYH